MPDQNAAPRPGTPEYDAAMAEKVDANAAAAAAASNDGGIKAAKPDNVPDEFWNAEKGEVDTEALLKAVSEGKKDEAHADESTDANAARAAVEAQGFDYAALQAEYDEHGDLTAETREKLAKAGWGKEVVDGYIEGQKALASQFVDAAINEAGGKDQFKAMQEWASTGLSVADLAAYNKAVEGTPEEALQAVRSLRAQYEAVYGRNPGLIGGTPVTGSTAGYASKAEMVAEMRDSRYEKDPAYRARVQAKVAATTAF